MQTKKLVKRLNFNNVREITVCSKIVIKRKVKYYIMGLYNYVWIYKLKFLNRIKVKALVTFMIYHKTINQIIIGILKITSFLLLFFNLYIT